MVDLLHFKKCTEKYTCEQIKNIEVIKCLKETLFVQDNYLIKVY